MLELEEARARILAGVGELSSVRVMLSEAHERVLAEPISATSPHPAFHQAAMDGYALRWEDVAQVSEGASKRLPVSIEAPAGAAPEVLSPGTAARIMTGGVLPEGADTVVMREDTDESDPASVLIEALPRAGRGAHVRHRGEHIEVGEALLSPGSVLDAGALAMLATFGRAVVSVRRRPVVALVSTGDELVEVGQAPGPGQIVNSSSWALASLVEAAGAQARLMPVARDDRGETRAVFEAALSSSDLVVSTGGVSVGDRDVVKLVLGDLCHGLDFWRVRVKPGKPLAFGRSAGHGTPIIGLPGNPVSAWVGFWQYVRPVLRAMLGVTPVTSPLREAVLVAPLRSTPKRLELQRGVLRWGGRSGYEFTPLRSQGSGDPRSLVGVNALAHVPIGVGSLEPGSRVMVECLERT